MALNQILTFFLFVVSRKKVPGKNILEGKNTKLDKIRKQM